MKRLTVAQLNAECERLAELLQHAEKRNADNIDSQQLEIGRLSEVIRHLQSDNRDLKQQVDVARANELGHKIDNARFGGMLDAYRDAGMIPRAPVEYSFGEPPIWGRK